jgi:hypothetical protein
VDERAVVGKSGDIAGQALGSRTRLLRSRANIVQAGNPTRLEGPLWRA